MKVEVLLQDGETRELDAISLSLEQGIVAVVTADNQLLPYRIEQLRIIYVTDNQQIHLGGSVDHDSDDQDCVYCADGSGLGVGETSWH